MKTIHRLFTLSMIAGLLLCAMLLVSCEEDSGTNKPTLSIVYEGFDETENIGPCYRWIFENTSDQEFMGVDITIRAFDENGEDLRPVGIDENSSVYYPRPGLNPGERIWIETYASEWDGEPVSYKASVKEIHWGSAKYKPVSITEVNKIYEDYSVSEYEVTVKNEGDEETVLEEGDSDTDSPRRPVYVAVRRDDDGNITYAEAYYPVVNDPTEVSNSNVTLSPGEEIKVLVTGDNNNEESEFIICWH